MLRRPIRRAGFSLVEVLVSLFILAAGLIALLTLFPLGAYQMAGALQDDRSQQTCLQADGKMREWWRTNVLEGSGSRVEAALNDPDDNGLLYAPIPSARRASYAVLFDPVGYASYSAVTKQQRVAQVNGGLPRRTLTPVPALPALPYRYASLPDDMEFAANGTPADRDGVEVTTSGLTIFRGGRFNWAALIQRPDNSAREVADLKILVFSRRSPGVDPLDNELMYGTGAATGVYSFPNGVAPNTVAVGDSQLVFAQSNDVLGLRVGSWVTDGTVTATIRGGNFYRVISVNDTVPGQTTVELHVPIAKPKGELVSAVPPAATTYAGQWYLFRELIDVYDRPQLAPNGYQKQTP
jgi:type II secretory pathway pseudopilin PulG